MSAPSNDAAALADHGTPSTEPADLAQSAGAPDADAASDRAAPRPGGKPPPVELGVIRRLYAWCLKWADTPYGVPMLVAISFAEASFFPIPPDILLLALCFGNPKKAFKFAFWCLVGSVVGGMFGYYIGYALWQSLSGYFIPHVFSQAAFDKVSKLYVDNAFLVIVAKGFTPIPFKVVTITAGVAKVSFGLFVAAAIICRSIRFFLVAGLIYFFGERVRPFIEKYLGPLLFLGFLLLVAGIVAIKFFR